MIDYTYTISTINRFGIRQRIGFGSEEQMFAACVALDREGGELLSATREVWDVYDGVAHFLRMEPYYAGKPQVQE